MRTRIQLARAQRQTLFFRPFGGLIGRSTGRISPYEELYFLDEKKGRAFSSTARVILFFQRGL